MKETLEKVWQNWNLTLVIVVSYVYLIINNFIIILVKVQISIHEVIVHVHCYFVWFVTVFLSNQL